ncbi:hypothetical protein [Methylopila sp. 73B]|uniref:hypothetical protein n=1 Tax=Methylopila sp. 73B TaxID=1120792 RepID=UPI00037FD21B|nr:hypothetical protein [Methylopila sp. 73B]
MHTASEVLDIARDAAAEAGIAMFDQVGDRADCGLAVVILPGRSPLVKAAKAEGIRLQKQTGGYAMSLCTGLRTQSRIVFEKACDAFVATAAAHGYEARTHSWAD